MGKLMGKLRVDVTLPNDSLSPMETFPLTGNNSV